MAKQDTQPTEYTWDTGTYQTGTTQENKGQSGIITALLIAVIFLGGLASALGLMNIRLLTELMQEQDPVLPISVNATDGGNLGFFRENEDLAPKLPQERELILTMGHDGAILTPEQVLQQNQASVVTVLVQNGQGLQQTGMGLVLSSDGYLLTNAHLTDGAHRITVELSDGSCLQAALVAEDVYSDLAVLYVQAQGMTAAAFEAPDAQSGLHFYAPERPDALVEGTVLTENRTLTVGSSAVFLQKTDFDAHGGPVFNEFGSVTGFLCRDYGSREQGMMLSSAAVMDIVHQLVEQGMVSGRPSLMLQAQPISGFCQQYWDLTGGLEITALHSDSQAQRLGLLQGDILLKLNGTDLTARQQLFDALLSAQPGESFEFEVFRAGQTFTVTLPVEQAP